MTQQHQNEQHPPPPFAAHNFITYARCIVMAFPSAPYFSFRFSNGSL